MSNIKLDKNTISELSQSGIKKIKVFFYDAGCSGTKIDITSDFEIDDSLICLNSDELQIYIEKKDKEKLENGKITKVVRSDHTGEEKVRYIFSSEEIKDRCGCGTSFSFEKKVPKINFEKLKQLKQEYAK